MQPKDLSTYIRETGVFILPSHFEPWGVVVHEYTAAGFPIICSDEVGAREIFVDNKLNGYIYKAGNVNQLKESLKKMIDKSDEGLFEMSECSAEKSKQITPEIWANKLIELFK